MSRFPDLTEQQIIDLLNSKDSKNTVKANKVAVSVFEAFLASKVDLREYSYEGKWTELTPVQLAPLLTKFYAEARTKKGDFYKRSTMLSLRNSINRHLNQMRRQRGDATVDLTKDLTFKEANTMLSVMKKILKENNKASVDHHEPISTTDLKKLREYFTSNKENPRVLQEQVFVNLMVHFGRRGRENLRSLKISDFAVTSDSDLKLYVYQLTDKRTKNHQDDDERKRVKMYQIQGEKKKVRDCSKILKNSSIHLFVHVVVIY